MRRWLLICLLLGLAVVLFEAWTQAQDVTPAPAAPTYSLPIFFARELPPNCRARALQRRHDFAMSDLSAPGYDIVVVGDSLVENWTPLPLARDYKVANRGIGCDTTNGLHERLLRDVVACRPKLAVVLIGINDLYLLSAMSAQDRMRHVAVNIASLVQRLQGHDIRVAVISLWPVRTVLTRATIDNSNEIIRGANAEIAAQLRPFGGVFLDIHRALADNQGWLREELTTDGLHPSAAGCRELNGLLEPTLRKLMQQ